jgi:hypothetical protein
MNHYQLREIAKFLSGMVAAKILTVIWLSWVGLLPLIMAGTPFSEDAIMPAMIFNVAVLSLLVYYGWHVKSPVHSPSERNLLYIVGAILLVVAAIHFTRLMFGFSFILGDMMVPQWVSWIGLVVAVYLSYSSFHFAMRMKGGRR